MSGTDMSGERDFYTLAADQLREILAAFSVPALVFGPLCKHTFRSLDCVLPDGHWSPHRTSTGSPWEYDWFVRGLWHRTKLAKPEIEEG